MDKKEIEHLAELSKLKFTEDELLNFSKEFESLIELADVVKNSTIKGDSYINIVDMNSLRDDTPMPCTPVGELLKNSPIVKNDSIVVPRIME